MRAPTILQAMQDPRLFGSSFADPSWRGWVAFVAVLFGLPLSADLASFARACTHRQDICSFGRFREAWLVVGRRAGKSRVLALIAVYLACFVSWKSRLAHGEIGVIQILAADRDQAGVILNYIKGFLASNPMLRALVTSEGAEHVTLATCKVSIEVHTSNFRGPRGRTCIACLLDEVAFWSSDSSANSAEETVRALRPSLTTLSPDSILIGASSPYSKAGQLWNSYSKHFGREGDRILVWQAASLAMNPSLNAEEIQQAIEDDEAAGLAEFGAQFRSDIERLFPQAVIEAATVQGRRELGRVPGIRYVAHVDPSGGSSDAMTLCIAHAEGEQIILDAIRARTPPFSPEQVAEEFASLLLAYGITSVTGDRYGGEWPREQFRKHGIRYDCSALTASAIYLEALPLLNAGRVELLDDPKLTSQLVALERRTSRGGKDTVSHPPLGHDDSANSACGAMVLAKAKPRAKIDFATQTFIGRSYADGLFMTSDRNPINWGDFREHTDW